MSNKGIQYAGEVNLDVIILKGSSGTPLKLDGLEISVTIHESIFAHALSGTVTLASTNNIAMNLPIIGQEYLSLKFTTPSLEEHAIDFTKNQFVVYKILERVTDGEVEALILKFTTPEMLKSNRVRVSKSYTNTVDKIAEDLLTNEKYLDTKKDLFIEPTSGIRRMVVPNLHPYNIIRNLATEATSKQHGSPHYLFFENNRGIHFRTLQSLYAQKIKAKYHHGDKGNDEEYSGGDESGQIIQGMKRVTNLNMGTNNDTLMNIGSGMLGSTIISHDIYNKSYRKDTFGYFDNFKDHERITENPIYNDNPIDVQNNTLGSFKDARIHLHSVPSDTDTQHYEPETSSYSYAPNKIDKSLLSRQSRLSELRDGIHVNVEVHGNTTIAAGDMVDLQLPIAGVDHNDDVADIYYSGRYIITNMLHTFIPQQHTHTINMTLSKDSLPQSLPKRTDAKQPQPKTLGMITKKFY